MGINVPFPNIREAGELPIIRLSRPIQIPKQENNKGDGGWVQANCCEFHSMGFAPLINEDAELVKVMPSK